MGNGVKLQHIESEEQLQNALSKSMTLSPEPYEKIYLNPKRPVSGDLRQTFAIPTPLGILRFTVALLPLSIELMGWRGSGGTFGTPTTTCKPGNAFSPGPTFAAEFGFYPLTLALLSFLFMICSLRTNAIFVVLFICATAGFALAAGGLFYTATGATATGTNLTIACGAAFFAADMLGWYLLFAIMIAVIELSVPDLPLFDLSSVIKARPRTKQE
ncbi:uncharacterized protein LTR77_002545 [Saxophila tyrrhenica]|uniref:Uncharacterized protein n=1 Tax=Saxophila tyrrhenica TaxID=1690608 RepID=A0AAV9PIY9_9PEZI|nr:hypothetical protein LTR77_002545 [Saxophila tyrrhenica]